MARKRPAKRKTNRGPTPPRPRRERMVPLADQAPFAGLPAGKLSDALVDFVSPQREEMCDLTSARFALQLGAVAWNLGLFSRDGRVEALRTLREQLVAAGLEELHETIVDLVRRKRQLYPDDRRLITDLQVTETTDGPRDISVVVQYEIYSDDAG